MIASLTPIYWLALVVGVLALVAAARDHIGLSAVLVSSSIGTTAACSAAEGQYVWTLLLGAATLAVPVSYWRHVSRQQAAPPAEGPSREDLAHYVAHEIGLENIADDLAENMLPHVNGLTDRTLTVERLADGVHAVVERYDGDLLKNRAVVTGPESAQTAATIATRAANVTEGLRFVPVEVSR